MGKGRAIPHKSGLTFAEQAVTRKSNWDLLDDSTKQRIRSMLRRQKKEEAEPEIMILHTHHDGSTWVEYPKQTERERKAREQRALHNRAAADHQAKTAYMGWKIKHTFK